MEKGFSSVALSRGYGSWTFLLGSTREQRVQIKSLNGHVQDKAGSSVSFEGVTRCDAFLVLSERLDRVRLSGFIAW